MELNDLRTMICSNTNNVIVLVPKQLRVRVDFKETSSSHHSAKVLCTMGVISMVAIETDLWSRITYNLRRVWHTVYVMLHEIHTIEKCDFLKSMIFF